MLTMSDVTRRTYEQRLDKLEAIAARLSGELVMASGHDPKAAERLHHNLEAIETEIELLLEALGSSDDPASGSEKKY
jgi:exonuclease VII small subunit